MGPSLFEVVLAQRACRWFTDEPVADDDLSRMLEAAIKAPSAENSQPWVFVVVRDPSARRAIGDLARQLWHGGARQHAAARVDGAMLADLDSSIDAGFGGAPVLIVVGADTTVVDRRTVASSMFPAVQNLLLAAAALGYGSALTTLVTFASEALGSTVALPAHIQPVAVVPIGRPLRRLGPSRRDPVSAKAHLDRFGAPWS
jgi:nitroreductase